MDPARRRSEKFPGLPWTVRSLEVNLGLTGCASRVLSRCGSNIIKQISSKLSYHILSIFIILLRTCTHMLSNDENQDSTWFYSCLLKNTKGVRKKVNWAGSQYLTGLLPMQVSRIEMPALLPYFRQCFGLKQLGHDSTLSSHRPLDTSLVQPRNAMNRCMSGH